MSNQFVLALSTSSGVAQVAAVGFADLSSGQAGQTLFEFEISDYKAQSATLLPTLSQQLERSGLVPGGCAAIAVDVGPGGFTSLRTACGVAQGLAYSWGVPTIPLSSFECMLPIGCAVGPVMVLIDARLSEVYAATLERGETGTTWLRKPFLMPLAELAGLQGPLLADANVHALLEKAGVAAEAGKVRALKLAQLAIEELKAGRTAEAIDCQPFYVRDKVAQTTSERLAGKHGAV